MMKKNLLLLSLLLISFSNELIKAQITFTSADLQESGETYVTKTDTITSVNIGIATLTAQNWDFSSLLTHYMSGPSFDLTSNTVYDTDYPNSDLYTYGPAVMFGGFFGGAPVSQQGMDNGYMFWRKDASGFWTEGFMADDGPYAGKKVWTVPQEMILGTPATLGTNYSNFSEWTLNYSDNAIDVDTLYKSSVNKTQECDAWGSLITPTATYPDVLRIHESGIKVDSVFATLGGNPVYSIELFRDTFNNYIFVANNIHYPLALVKADKNNVIRSVEYYFTQGFLEIETNNELKGAMLYPNPTEGILTIELSSALDKECSLILTDSFGKIVSTHLLQHQKNLIDCTMIESGIYFYKLINGLVQETGKIVIK
jgi:hypothetical protein